MIEDKKLDVQLLMITPDCEKVIESCGRTCYESYDKITEDSHEKLIRHLIKNGHTSVLEHASATFRFSNVSRSLTHQLVRHRIASYSQKSQRYVKELNFDYVTPDSIKNNEIAIERYQQGMAYIGNLYDDLVALGVRKEDARYVLPNACSTVIDATFNFRSLMNFFNERGNKHAQWEIRYAAMIMLGIVKQHAPTVFETYENDNKEEVIRRAGEQQG